MSVIVGKGSKFDLVLVAPVEARACVWIRLPLEVEKGRADADSMLARDVFQIVDSGLSIVRADLLVVRRQSRKLRRKIGYILGNPVSRLYVLCVDVSCVLC
jgi:hypothetical protein